MLRCKQKCLISDNAADKKLNAAAFEAINTDKEWNTAADQKLNTVADKTKNADKKRDVVARK